MAKEMDLAQVKVVVKTWGKAFKAKHARPPTKEDIKADTGGIADHYALYRRLSKAAAGANPSASSRPGIPHASSSTSSSQPAPASQTSSSSQAGPSRSTPRHIPANEYPTTPTPPARRRYTTTATNEGQDDGQGGVLKRKASATALQYEGRERASGYGLVGGSTAIHTFLTPRKSAARPTSASTQTPRGSQSQSQSQSQGYTGPILDPHPSNPFSASPRKSQTPLKSVTTSKIQAAAAGIYSTGPLFGSPSKRSNMSQTVQAINGAGTPHAVGAAAATSSSAWDANSPFIHATTPKKLKQVLAANSLRKVRARADPAPASGTAGGGDELEDMLGSPSKGMGNSPFKRLGQTLFGTNSNGRSLGLGGEVEITPRTKARKRLAGEMVAPTPGKAAPRKRGMMRLSSDGSGAGGTAGASATDEPTKGASQKSVPGKRAMMMMDEDEHDDDEEDGEGQDGEDDAFGPSPAKGGLLRSFTSLIGEAISDDDEESEGHAAPTRSKGYVDGANRHTNGQGIFANRLAASQVAMTPRPGTSSGSQSAIIAGSKNHKGGDTEKSQPSRTREREQDVKSGREAKRVKPRRSRTGLPAEAQGYAGAGGGSARRSEPANAAREVDADVDEEEDEYADMRDSGDSRFLNKPDVPADHDETGLHAGGGEADDDFGPDDARLPTPPPYDDDENVENEHEHAYADPHALAHDAKADPRAQIRRKVLSLSDDEIDEFDPEADRHRRVTIVPTRRVVRRRNSSDLELEPELEPVERSSLHGTDRKSNSKFALHRHSAQAHVADANAEGDVNMDMDTEAQQGETNPAAPSTPTAPSSTRLLTPPGSASASAADSQSQSIAPPQTKSSKSKKGNDIPPHLLSLLSLRSPVRPRSKTSGAMADLRARAIFDVEAKRELRAIEKGQEVRVAGAGAGTGAGVSSGRGFGLGVAGQAGHLGIGGGEEEEERLLALYGARSGLTLSAVAEPHRRARAGNNLEKGDTSEDAEDAEEEEEEGQGEGEGAERGWRDVEDDDWESESEGWKRTGEDMDDW